MIRQNGCCADNPKQVKTFKCANENKNIAIIGFKNLMKAHKHKQTLDLDLLWIIFLSGKFGLMYVCWRNVTATYLQWLYVSLYPLVTSQRTDSHMMSYEMKKKKVLSISLIFDNLHSIFSIIRTIPSHTGGGRYFAASSYPFILTFSVTTASQPSFASSSWPEQLA